MKRLHEKVKDILEASTFEYLVDLSDPAATVKQYRFTDITADLASKWIHLVAGVSAGKGTAAALAGFRGVGKSHFLGVLAAVLGVPEYRRFVEDDHVASALNDLPKKPYPVAIVKRGTGLSLLDEVRNALVEKLGDVLNAAPLTPHDLLVAGMREAGDLPLVVLVDTAPGRESRLTRDDGAILSQMAEAARPLGIFIGVALDDDIAAADGANSSIARHFQIDFLDQAHLYKIIELYIFPKSRRAAPLLHTLYADVSAVVAGFKWSEERFSMLYPLHPAVVEIAPLIRLYLQQFAVLGFAAGLVAKTLNRPANALVGLDEIFDALETSLRDVRELESAFDTFDLLEASVIDKAPAFSRFQLKVLLKSLFLLSLQGRPVSAAEIATWTMLPSGSSSSDLEQALTSFAEASPSGMLRTATGYQIKVGRDDSNGSPAEESTGMDDNDAGWAMLLAHTAERFSDCDPDSFKNGEASRCIAEWRGTLRRGHVYWGAPNQVIDDADWAVHFRHESTADNPLSLSWKPGSLTDAEKSSLKSLALREGGKSGEDASPPSDAALEELDAIWTRAFLLDGVLANEAGDEFCFAKEAVNCDTLAGLFTLALEPILDRKYPDHPTLDTRLGYNETGQLIAGFFGGSATETDEIQRLAAAFAEPIGLAERDGSRLIPIRAEKLIELPWVMEVIGGRLSDIETVSVSEAAARGRGSTYGPSREELQLLLSALVSQRQFEFVTDTDTRINHRSLDLQIIWEDIPGIARVSAHRLSSQKLVFWTRLLTGREGLKASTGEPELAAALDEWLTLWESGNVLRSFDSLPDEHCCLSLWKLASKVSRSFGEAASLVSRLRSADIDLETCLAGVAELFSESSEEFGLRKSDLEALRLAIETVDSRRRIEEFLAVAEIDGDADLEKLRQSISWDLLRGVWAEPVLLSSAAEFQSRVAEFRTNEMKVHVPACSSEKLQEVFKSEDWGVFLLCRASRLFDTDDGLKTDAIIRVISRRRCGAGAASPDSTTPACTCSLRSGHASSCESLIQDLRLLIDGALKRYEDRLRDHIGRIRDLAPELPSVAAGRLLETIDAIESGSGLSCLTAQDICTLNALIPNALASDGQRHVGGLSSARYEAATELRLGLEQ